MIDPIIIGDIRRYQATMRAHAAGDVPVRVARSLGEIHAPDLGSARLVAELFAGRYAPAALGWDVEVEVQEVRDAE